MESNVNEAISVIKTDILFRAVLTDEGDQFYDQFVTSLVRKQNKWEKTFSGALSEEQISASLVVMTIFYLFYTLFNAFEGEDRDEEAIVRSCRCNSTHRDFYISWTVICCCLWGFCHLFLTVGRIFPVVPSYTNKLMRKVVNRAHSAAKTAYEASKELFFDDDDDEDDDIDGYDELSEVQRKMKRRLHYNIKQYNKYLWSQSYDLYSVGIKKKNDEEFDLHNVDKMIIKSLTPPQPKKPSTEELPTKRRKRKALIEKRIGSYVGCGAKCSSHFLVFFLLNFAQFMAQFAVVPLLLVQMFDTYTLLCIAEEDYCSSENQNRLHLDQTALTFAFYCSLMISLLTTLCLRWVSWPKLNIRRCLRCDY